MESEGGFYSEDVRRTEQEARTTLDRLLGNSIYEAAIDDLIAALGTLIDLSGELQRPDATDEAIRRGNLLLDRALTDEQRVTVHYYLANVWEVARNQRRSRAQLAEWEQPELAPQVIHLRHAVHLIESVPVPRRDAKVIRHRHCQVYTNLGNLMSHIGRFVEAIACWDMAVALDKRFAMAIANRAYGLFQYGRLVHDPGHQVKFLRAADAGLTTALQPRLASQMHTDARAFFTQLHTNLRERVPAAVLKPPAPHAHMFRKRMSRHEREYREWCLAHRLFLNDLNDLEQRDPLVARDVLTLPDFTTPIDAALPHAYGFFNQLKQEFTSARLLYFEGVHAERVHFADRDVTLIDTLDYAAYGHAIEQIKIAYRLAYSLFDKLAYFLNDYLALGIPEKRVSFRGVWYVQENRERGLRLEVSRPENTAFKALFWLAKDFYEDDPAFTEAIEPDAKDLAALRNHLEHKYVKLHLFGVPSADRLLGRDPLAHALDRTDFERRTLRILQLARSAVIYLSMGVYAEEARRRSKYPDQRVVALPLFEVQDRFKL